MESFPPAPGPARSLDDVLADLAASPEEAVDTGPDGPPPELPEVVEAVTGRARDLHRLADRLSADGSGEGPDGNAGTLSAVALLRAHAGRVDDLAEHLQAAGAEGTPPEPPTERAPEPADPAAAGPSSPLARPPRGTPRSVG